ncbi:hypothetical protein [Paucibacter sp. B51]|uniref:hypothetical protein n=1 Tax=Paucibacter sp. B51 TaxID=2993315 RepID=UPI0022EBABFB|nr:hypothetical protein [Paucibacter sp. B51]
MDTQVFLDLEVRWVKSGTKDECLQGLLWVIAIHRELLGHAFAPRIVSTARSS